jgi:hypothetical protein
MILWRKPLGFHDDEEEAKWKAKAFRYLVFLSPEERGNQDTGGSY